MHPVLDQDSWSWDWLEGRVVGFEGPVLALLDLASEKLVVCNVRITVLSAILLDLRRLTSLFATSTKITTGACMIQAYFQYGNVRLTALFYLQSTG